MRRIFLNGKEYPAKPFDFNLVCDLEDMGVSIEEVEKKPLSVMRAYICVCMNTSKEKCGLEIQKHMQNGGDFDGIMKVIGAEMEESDFFRGQNQGAEKKTGTHPGKKKKNYNRNGYYKKKNTGRTGNITQLNGSRKRAN